MRYDAAGVFSGEEKLELVNMVDITYYWSAGKLALSGGNCYLIADMQRMFQESGSDPGLCFQFNYPPYALCFFFLLGLLSFTDATIAWVALMVIVFVISAYLQTKVALDSLKQITFSDLFKIALLYPVFQLEFFWGQSNFIVLLGLSGYLFFKPRQQYFLSGLMLGITFIKPQLLVLFYTYWLATELRNKRFTSIAGLSTCILIQVLITGLFAGHVYAQYWEALPKIIAASTNYTWGTTLPQVLATKAGIQGGNIIGFLLCVIIGVAVALKNFKHVRINEHLLIPLSIILAPHAFMHASLIAMSAWLCCAPYIMKIPSLIRSIFLLFTGTGLIYISGRPSSSLIGLLILISLMAIAMTKQRYNTSTALT